MITQLRRTLLLAAAAALMPLAAEAQEKQTDRPWQDTFDLKKCSLLTTGKNSYFILEPGYRTVLQNADEKLQITVLDETEVVDGVTTRVVEEREWKDGKLHEISRNYFAFCKETGDIFYFGEHVDNYEGEKVVNHDGSWRAGKDNNKPGLIMPGTPKVGMKYYQEVAPGVAMDRAEIVSVNETCKTPAGTFSNCLKVKEQSVRDFLERMKFWEVEYKFHAPGIGLVQDENLLLTKVGK